VIAYEQQLSRDFALALKEGSMHFEKESSVHRTLKQLARRLDALEVPYAIVGGMALFYHGYRRFTDDVDLLVTRESLDKIHRELEGLGYVPPFAGSKQLRDADTGVRIEFLVAGEYPGDGKPKPVVFPDPVGLTVKAEDLNILQLPRLIDLKLASGMSNPRRGKDLIDVQELIEALQLSESFAEELHPYVQDKFRELWQVVHSNPP
jgi:hypothetical protein